MFAWLKRLFGMDDTPTIIPSVGDWGFTAVVDGDDIVVRGGEATWFGGADDPDDDGETASGVNTKLRPTMQGCALPLNYGPCAGSPIPNIPWGSRVQVTYQEKTITVPVIDLGPARDTGNAIDLTVTAFEEFAPREVGKIVVDYRILGAAKRLV